MNKNSAAVLLISFFFALRTIHLTALPIFNDEAIYLDWGYRELYNDFPKNMMYSLHDGKQPLLMWMFALARVVFPDPLVAGRMVSVGMGLVSAVGLYLIGKRLISTGAGYLSAFLYTIIPLFSLYDRQALMESALGSVGIWSFYAFLRMAELRKIRYAAGLAIVLAVGFWIKSTAALFFFSTCILGTVVLFGKKGKEKSAFAIRLVVYFVLYHFLILPLVSHDLFWHSVSANDRFVLSVGELAALPFALWARNFVAALRIALVFLTPFVVLVGLSGILEIVGTRNRRMMLLITWFFGGLVGYVIMLREPAIRHLVPFLPAICVFASFSVFSVRRSMRPYIIILISVVPVIFTGIQIFSPIRYFTILDTWTGISGKSDYVTGWTSGYGIPEAVSFFRERAEQKQIIVGVRLDAGNPESAMFAYFQGTDRIFPAYLDSRVFVPEYIRYDCLNTPYETYFVSRDTQLAGIEKFLVPIQTIEKPEGQSSIGIYKVLTGCPVEKSYKPVL